MSSMAMRTIHSQCVFACPLLVTRARRVSSRWRRWPSPSGPGAGPRSCGIGTNCPQPLPTIAACTRGQSFAHLPGDLRRALLVRQDQTQQPLGARIALAQHPAGARGGSLIVELPT